MCKLKLFLCFHKKRISKDYQTIGIAFHEAAHSVIGYTQGHSTNYIDITFDERRRIYPQTDKDFNADTLIIIAFNEHNLHYLSSLDLREVVLTGERYCLGLLAGTYAEYYKLNGTLCDPRKNSINRIDMMHIRNCLNALNALSEDFQQDETYEHCRRKIRNLVLNPDNWSKIERIAELLLATKANRIDKEEIEKIIG